MELPILRAIDAQYNTNGLTTTRQRHNDILVCVPHCGITIIPSNITKEPFSWSIRARINAPKHEGDHDLCCYSIEDIILCKDVVQNMISSSTAQNVVCVCVCGRIVYYDCRISFLFYSIYSIYSSFLSKKDCHLIFICHSN